MSKANDRLRAIGIHNSWEVMTRAARDGLKEDVWIYYQPGTTGRSSRTARWVVDSTSQKTDPGGHWMDYNRKVFPTYGGVKERPEKLTEALMWVADKYGITDWEKIPGVYGTALFPKSVADHIKSLLKEVDKS